MYIHVGNEIREVPLYTCSILLSNSAVDTNCFDKVHIKGEVGKRV